MPSGWQLVPPVLTVGLGLQFVCCDAPPSQVSAKLVPSAIVLPTATGGEALSPSWAPQDELVSTVRRLSEGAELYRSVTSLRREGERIWWFRRMEGTRVSLAVACETTRPPFEMKAQIHGHWLAVATYEGRPDEAGGFALRQTSRLLAEPVRPGDGKLVAVGNRDDGRNAEMLTRAYFDHPHSVCGLLPQRIWLQCDTTMAEVRPVGAVAELRQSRRQGKRAEYEWNPPTRVSRSVAVCRISVEVMTSDGHTEMRPAKAARPSWDRLCSDALRFSSDPGVEAYECIDHRQSALRVLPNTETK